MEPENFSKPQKMFSGEMEEEAPLRVKVIGIGGGGTNVIDKIQLNDLSNVHLAVVNTDIQALSQNLVPEKIQIGRNVTFGMGAGGDVETGLRAAEAEMQALEKAVKGYDLIFLVSALGGGTGSGATPYISALASEAGAMVISFVLLPFTFEAGRREKADQALESLRKHSDAVIPLSNDLLLQLSGETEATFLDAFSQADDWVCRGVTSICSMLLKTGLINQDFSSLKRIFQERGGRSLFGIGSASGDNSVEDALDDLFLCPLLQGPEFAKRADNLLVHITGGPDLTMSKVNQVMSKLSDKLGSRENLVLGAMIDDSLRHTLEICVIGTTNLSSKRYTKPPAAAVSQNRKHGFESLQAEHEVMEKPFSREGITTTSGELPVHESKLKPKQKENPWDQNEFEFLAEEEQRGYFDKTERNVFDGEDLDVPTFLRRGIRVAVKD